MYPHVYIEGFAFYQRGEKKENHTKRGEGKPPYACRHKSSNIMYCY